MPYVNHAKQRKAGKDLKISNDLSKTQVEREKAAKRRAKYEERILREAMRQN